MGGKQAVRVVLALAAVAGVVGLASCKIEEFAGGAFESVRTESATFPTTGIPVLEVESANGAVSVQGVPGQTDIRVTATVHSRGRTQSAADAYAAAAVLHMEQQGSKVLLAYRWAEQTADVRRFTGVSFEVTTPTVVGVNAATSNGAVSLSAVQGHLVLETSNGEITAADVVGEIQATTSSGRISADRCQGVLRLGTSNGEIRMSDVSAAFDATTSNGAIGFRGTIVGDSNTLVTSNGRIDVAVSPSASVEFHAVTSAGSISSALPLVGDTQGREWLATLNPPPASRVSLETSNGAIRITPLP